MTELKNIWVEHDHIGGHPVAIRVDWSNDRHQRVGLNTPTPESLTFALDKMARLIRSEIENGNLK